MGIPPLTVTAWLRWDAAQPLLPPAGCRVLDIGAGTGTVGSLLAERYTYVGLEPDPASHAVATQRIGAHGIVHNSSAEQFNPAADFDLVCAFEVLEHIEDDAGALATWASCLCPGGALLVSVPGGRERFAAGDERVGHLRRYDPQELVGKLLDAGLADVVTVAYGSPWGNLQEAIRHLVFTLRPSGKSPAELTAESARFLQPPTWSAYATRALAVPLRFVQRPLSDRGIGTGLIGFGRVPGP